MTDSSSKKAAPLRLNARIDAELATKIEQMKRRTGQTVTQLVREALELYYESLGDHEADPYSRLQEAGFIACVDGDKDLSTTYKQALARSLDVKA